MKEFTLYIDGGARGNPGPAGIGGVVIDANDKIIFAFSEYIGETTNNIAEYHSLIYGLEKALELKTDRLNIYSDSELLVSQIRGLFKIKNQGLKPLFSYAKELIARFKQVKIAHIPREENFKADKLVNEAIDGFLKGEKSQLKLEGIARQEKLF